VTVKTVAIIVLAIERGGFLCDLPPERQPHIPHTEWVKQVCQFLVESGEAEWVKGSEETQLVIFYQRYDDPMHHFISSYVTLEEKKKSEPMLPGFESTEITGTG